MTERPFETKLARDLGALADEGVRPVDARRLALEIVGTGRPSRTRSILGITASRARWVAVAAILLLVLLLSALLVGGLTTQRNRLGPLAFVRAGDVWASAKDGSDQRLVAAAGPSRQEYLYVRWSPDGTRLAAVRDTGDQGFVPAIELYDRVGRHLWTQPLDPGGLPDVSWAPDSRRLAIAAFPTIAPTTGDLLVDNQPIDVTPITLLVLDVDGPRTELQLRAATLGFARPADPRIPLWIEPYVRWSPTSDGIALKALGPGCCDPWIWTMAPDGSNRHLVVGPESGVAPAWFAWRPNGRDIDVVGQSADRTCPDGRVVAGSCTAGFWTTGPAGGVSFTAVPTLSGAARAGDPVVQTVTWLPDQRRVLLALGVIPTAQPVQASTEPNGWDCVGSLDVFDPVAGTRVTKLSGSWDLSERGPYPITVDGEAFEPHGLAWAAASTSLYRLGAATGPASEDGWAIRVSDIDAGGPSTTAVDGVTQFDLASRP